MVYSTKAFWTDLAERVVSTAAQAAIGVLTAGAVGLLSVDWINVASVAGLAALLSFLKAFAKGKTIVATGSGTSADPAVITSAEPVDAPAPLVAGPVEVETSETAK